jgi:hypothetical protein
MENENNFKTPPMKKVKSLVFGNDILNKSNNFGNEKDSF